MKRNKERRQERQAEAKERAEVYAALSPKAKIARLDRRLGVGTGARRERQRIADLAVATEKNEKSAAKNEKKREA